MSHSRSFLANQKARNAIFGAENLLMVISKFSAPNIALPNIAFLASLTHHLSMVKFLEKNQC